MTDRCRSGDPLARPASTACPLCRLVEPYTITWFEEPLAGNDALKLAELRRKTGIPISAGQNEGHRWRHRELIVNGAVDIVQPNVLFVGGYTEALKVAHLLPAFRARRHDADRAGSLTLRHVRTVSLAQFLRRSASFQSGCNFKTALH